MLRGPRARASPASPVPLLAPLARARASRRRDRGKSTWRVAEGAEAGGDVRGRRRAAPARRRRLRAARRRPRQTSRRGSRGSPRRRRRDRTPGAAHSARPCTRWTTTPRVAATGASPRGERRAGQRFCVDDVRRSRRRRPRRRPERAWLARNSRNRRGPLPAHRCSPRGRRVEARDAPRRAAERRAPAWGRRSSGTSRPPRRGSRAPVVVVLRERRASTT